MTVGAGAPLPKEGSERRIQVDAVIVSVGTKANPLLTRSTSGLELTKRGNIVADENTLETSKKGVFAGGDIVTGSATVILAMGAGKTARAFHRPISAGPAPAERGRERSYHRYGSVGRGRVVARSSRGGPSGATPL